MIYETQKNIIENLEKDKKELNDLYEQCKRNHVDYDSIKNQLETIKKNKDRLEKDNEELKNKMNEKEKKIDEINNNVKEIFNIVKDLPLTLLHELVKEIEKNNYKTVDINEQIKRLQQLSK
ncbi:6459_t:CDS:1 [Scutellospora calospora]|uniref:6459_t:CDS:1 n=1 Tax=Scutellospora calospora TaxID=85575 RepID=A0ACA9KRN2_9GLOM|nr:6459_t:CDS:1 [Scutellospora calospora]